MTVPVERSANVAEDARWLFRSWRQVLFPAVFLVYLAQTGAGVVRHTDGIWTAIGMLLLVGFCACYLLAGAAGRAAGDDRRFWGYYAAALALTAAELPLAHQDALVMLVYVSVLTVAARWLKAIPLLVGYLLVATLLPPAVPSWHAALDFNTPLAIAIISLAMFGFFAVVRSNRARADARSEVARLATENERARIARDLHDLLGHSLTTITVKAALANRLAAADPARATAEIAEVEALTRRTLADVRAAVSGYREVTLANELAAAREVLRAAGVDAELPRAIDAVEQADAELFGWVVREGVTNVVRHARARTCRVVLGARAVEIVDDGRGPAGSAGNGLTGLCERVAAAGGRLTFGAGPDGRGSRLLVELPAPDPVPENLTAQEGRR